ncbi:MAG: hypothetical protein ACKVY0_19455 [Prosthecobacter sp.]|uniref:hypothetical protein n=1 Tax=Prosthecobacter sp. TaxID=1965333 RepID=UPI0039041AC1
MLPPTVINADSGSATAKKAAQFLAEKKLGYVVPTARQKRNLVVACAKRDLIVYGKAFDVLRLTGEVDLDSLEDVEAKLAQIVICEIKSTKQKFPDDFRGYFFGLTAAEVLVAQSLKDQFRFIFVNTVTGSFLELKLSEVFAKARGIYPTWSISF